MKKLINGLRRKTTPTPPPTPITTNEPQETNYAILFDNDQDESSKENTHNTNNPPKKTNVVKKGGKPRRRKKRISKPTTIMNGASRGVQTMMTISEIVEEGIEVDDLLADREHEVGEDETVIVVEVDDEMVDEGVSIVESGVPDEESDEITNDVIVDTGVPADLNDSGAIYSDSDSSEECAAEDDEELGESLIDLEESVVGEEGVDNNNDDEVDCEEVIVAPAIGESSTDEVVVDESDYDSSEEIIAQEMNSAEAVQQQQQQQQEQDPHNNTNQVCQSPITNISKEDAHHEYLKSIGLYTPSSFMQSLRLKYRIDLECHA